MGKGWASLLVALVLGSAAAPVRAEDLAELLDKLASADSNGRATALNALRAAGPTQFGVVLKGLQDRRLEVRRGAAAVLLHYSESMPSVESYGDVLARALRDKDAEIRKTVGRILLKAGPKNMKAIERAFASKYLDAREAAAGALAAIGDQALPILRRALESTAFRRRDSAIFAIGCLGSDASEFVPQLLSLLSDADARIRRRTARSLGLGSV